jgi:hypothetical protein
MESPIGGKQEAAAGQFPGVDAALCPCVVQAREEEIKRLALSIKSNGPGN